MRNVLIVDDEKPFLLSLSDGLSIYAGDFNVITAEHGVKAVEVLRSTKIDLVVTDLKMPVMDGFELLSYMSKNDPNVPVIVMSAYGTLDIERSLKEFNISQFIEKPIDYGELARTILDEVTDSSEGHIHGITLPAFLQLVEMERKTCTLKITSKDKVGYLYFKKGDFMDAETEKSKGDDAAYDIVCWEKAEIDIEPVCRKKRKNVALSLGHTLMEAFRLKDERERREFDSGGIEALVMEKAFAFDFPRQGNKPQLRMEDVMALENHLQSLKEIKGYKASGVMNFTGEMLAYDSSDPNIDLTLVGATFNDIFRSAHEASKKIGLDACKETVISTPKGVVVMRCSGTDAKSHFHLIGIMANDGNQALMKMQIDKLVPAVMAELA